MAKKSVGGGPFKDSQTRRERLSSIVSGDTRDRNKAGPSLVRMTSAALSPRLGMPVGSLGGQPRAAKDQSRVFSERTLGGLKQRTAVAAPKPKAKPANPVNVVRDVVRTITDMRTTPAKAAGPKRMAVNPRTGSTLGFTTGSKTGSTVSKAGTAFRTPMTPGQRANRAAFDRSGVAGPSKDSSGRNRSSATGKGAFGGGKKK